MKRLCSILLLFLLIVGIPAAASAALKPDDDPTILEGLKDKGFDWLKDKAKDAGQSWVFDTDQSETMHEILLKARERADGLGNDQNGLCRGAVMGKASSILNDINYKWTAKTAGKLAFDTVTKMAGLAAGFGGAAAEGDAINWLVQQYADAAKDQAKDSVFDRIKKLFGEEKKPEFELYETSGKNGDCDYTLRAVWDIVHGTYRVYIAGDCHCKEVGNVGVIPRPLGKWWISFEGHLKLQVEGKTTSWAVGEPRMDFDAQCACSTRKLREAFAQAVKEQPSTTGPGGSSQPTGPPPLPRAGRKVCKECQKIQDEIDADTKALEQVLEDVGQLDAAHRRAEAKLGQDEGSLDDPAAYGTTKEKLQQQIEQDKAAIKANEAESRRLEAEQIRLKAALRDLAKLLEDCIKTHCPDDHSSISKPTNEQYAVAPPPVRRCDEQPLSSLASAALAIHNKERAEVGAEPVCWNPELAQHAAEYAQELARTGELTHAPREGRGIERENLSEGLPWWSPSQLINIWTGEKKYFHPGTFPNVCEGDWTQCAHYSQMIWAMTTDIGCGAATGRGHTWLVCRYSPGGNKDGKAVGTPEAAADAHNSRIRARLVGGDYGHEARPLVKKGKAVRYQWIDVKTGQAVPSGPLIPFTKEEIKADLLAHASPWSSEPGPWVHPVEVDASDPDHAFDPKSGRNFVYDEAASSWIDAKTRETVPSGPLIPFTKEEIKADLLAHASPWSPEPGPWVHPVQVDASDPNRAFDPKSGRNFAKVPVPSK